jgi:hypothetical protein
VWFSSVREEFFLLIGIVVCIGGTLLKMPMQYETLLWTAILATQSIPYLSAFTCALISAYSGRSAPPVHLSAVDGGNRLGLAVAAAEEVKTAAARVVQPVPAHVGAEG